MARKRNVGTSAGEAAMWLLFFALLVPAGVVGWAIGDSTSGGTKTVTAAAPAGHQGGANLPVSAIGDPAKGQALFDSKHCSDCHTYNGHGGKDAPALDYMRGHLSAREIAGMAGTIWNHLPKMEPHFKEEGIPLPTFTTGEMADLIAYLHGGPPKGAAQTTTEATTSEATTTEAATTTGETSASTTTAAAGGDAAKGKQLFAAQGCGSCHTFAAAGASGTVGPDLDKALSGDAKKAGQSLDAFVRESIVKPDAYIASGFQAGVMPGSYGQSLSDSQVADLVAFLTAGG